uniref:Uncharacterized protein n=1 Tax=Populus trichocarpa TaxID=3694 RepID=A0A3N7FZC4_POPTR
MNQMAQHHELYKHTRIYHLRISFPQNGCSCPETQLKTKEIFLKIICQV